MLRTAFAVLAGAALVAAPPAAAQSKPPKLKMGIYDCYSYDSSRSSLDYSSSIKLAKKGRYEHTRARNGKRMVRASKGTYRIKGTRLTFARGVLNKVAARISAGSTPSNPAKFNLLARNGKAAGITCTYNTSKTVNP
jgi:hypothetical protein